MRIVPLAILLVLLGAAGVVTARPEGDEAHQIDLSAVPGGPILFIKCSSGGNLAKDCGVVSLWQQTNGRERLQSTIFAFGGRHHEPDAKLLG